FRLPQAVGRRTGSVLPANIATKTRPARHPSQGRQQDLLELGDEFSPLLGPSNRQAASMRSLRCAAINVSERSCPCGTLPETAAPRIPIADRAMFLDRGLRDRHAPLGIIR